MTELFLALPRKQGAATRLGHFRIHTTFPPASVQEKMMTDFVNIEISVTTTLLLLCNCTYSQCCRQTVLIADSQVCVKSSYYHYGVLNIQSGFGQEGKLLQ